MDMIRPPNICRTCLKRTHKTFSTQQNIDDTGNLKISQALRYLIPELYLGLSTNPEICLDCKETLKSAYHFKKTCLYTENVIGTFLKKSRCTGQSVDLHDVLLYLDTDKLNIEKKSVKASIISEWEDDSSDELNDEPAKSTRSGKEKAPMNNEEKIDIEKKKLSFCEETGLFVNEEGTFFNAHGSKIEDSQIQREKENLKKKINSLFEISNVYSLSDVENTANKCDSLSSLTPKEKLFSSSNLSHHVPVVPTESPSQLLLANPINSVNQTIKPSDRNVQDIDPSDYNFIAQGTVGKKLIPTKGKKFYYLKKPTQNQLFRNKLNSQLPVLPMVPNYKIFKSKLLQPQNSEIKQSHLMLTNNSSQGERVHKTGQKKVKSTYNASVSKNTLEPVSIEPQLLNIKEEPIDLHCDENFLSQDEDTLTAPESTAYENNLQDIIDNLEHDDTSQYVDIPEFVMINKFSIKDLQDFKKNRNTTMTAQANQAKESQPAVVTKANSERTVKGPRNELFHKTDNSLTGTFLSSAKKVIKTKTFASSVNLGGLLEDAKSSHPIPSDLENKSVLKTRERREKLLMKRKLKIVPVTETDTDVAQVVGKVVKIPGGDENRRNFIEVCPKLAMDGTYIDDHDYLHSPYIRHNILIKKPNGWTCMCFICGGNPIISRHLSHMKQHSSQCKICFLDLGTPLSLNFHVKRHFQHCLICKVRVAYGDMDSHERWHKDGLRSVLKNKWNNSTDTMECKMEPDENSSDSDNITLSTLIKNRPTNSVLVKHEDEHNSDKNNSRKRKDPSSKAEGSVEPSSRVLRSKVKKITETEDATIEATEKKEGTP